MGLKTITPPRIFSIEFFRRQLATVDALPQLSFLAVAVGLITGAVIIIFRMLIDYALIWMLGSNEGFEELTSVYRLVYPLTGCVLIGLLLLRLRPSERRVGVVHVMERLTRHQGHLPLKNAVVQFFGGIIALVSGVSGGREGPAIHLGAASASLIGQTFQLPNNSMRVLVACGSAAAIASAFNTPIAGVIFAMEVVMMEYAIGRLLPVIIAAVTSTFLSHYFVGSEAAFAVSADSIQSLAEVPYIVFAGVIIGCLAAAFNKTIQWFARFSHWPVLVRFALAGAITGAAALVTPEIMGVGYDSLSAAMLGNLTLTTLIAIVILKSITNAAAVGFGLPVGLIGPTLVIGAAVGGIVGIIGQQLQPENAASVGFYVMLGMSAMMAAVLQAPLAALMAVLELTANPHLILPAMLIIVVATLMASEVFKSKSVYLMTLDSLGLQYPRGPMTLHLQNAGVTAIMSREFVRLSQIVSRLEAERALEKNPHWIIVDNDMGQLRSALTPADLRAFLTQHEDVDEIDLLKLPGRRKDVAGIDARATVEQAQIALSAGEVEALCVQRMSAPMIFPVMGVITQESIDNYTEVGL
ncbi:MAG: chloride channel protein [Proteobacteria bacterium]|nr:chloride channel protein [Pseudomonadota bacterium]